MAAATLIRIAALACCAIAPALAADRFDDVRAYIRSGLVEHEVPSIAVAVVKDGAIIWEEGFGWADREQRIESTPQIMYSLASISKPITATGLMTLVQAGRIDLDKPINDYLGAEKLRARVGDATDATVRRVANHTSGLPLHAQFFYTDEPYTKPSMEETILRYGNLVTAPGEEYQYSNLGYGVLDHLIERISGEDFSKFMRSEVFLPLGMTRSSVGIGPGLESFTATRYGKDGLPLPFYDFNHPGASAVFSSAHDLARFAMFQLKAHLREQRAILSDGLIDEMQRRTARTPGKGYGIGFDVSARNEYLVVSHGGNMSGVNTSLQLFPSENLAIVVLSNANSPLTATVADRLANELLPGWTSTAEQAAPGTRPFAAPETLSGVWQGLLHTYTHDLPVVLHFPSEGEPMVKIGDQPVSPINDAQYRDGEFNGRLAARIGTPDTERFPYHLALNLRLRDGTLNGSAIALAVEGTRAHFALSHWLSLERVRADPAN